MTVCCTECFRDPFLRALIEKEGVVGACDFCGQRSHLVVAPNTLAEYFKRLFALYDVIPAPPSLLKTESTGDLSPIPSPDEMLASLTSEEVAAWRARSRSGRDLRLYPPRNTWHWWETESSKTLSALLMDNWEVFSRSISDENRTELLRLLLEETGLDSETVGENWHWMAKKDVARGKDYEWQWYRFGDYLRTERRFILDVPKSIADMRAVIQASLPIVDRILDAGEATYRALRSYVESTGEQFSIDMPLPSSQMGAPPARRTAAGGRLNPPGIVFLYLASDEVTAVAEKRPPKGAVLSVTRIETTRDLRIADFTDLRPLDSPFGHDDLVEEVELRRFLDLLSSELAQPIDQAAASIEYVPTQFAAEAIRDAGFDGILHASALGPGNNLVLFSSEDAQPVNGSEQLVRVTNVEYAIERDTSAEANELYKRV